MISQTFLPSPPAVPKDDKKAKTLLRAAEIKTRPLGKGRPASARKLLKRNPGVFLTAGAPKKRRGGTAPKRKGGPREKSPGRGGRQMKKTQKKGGGVGRGYTWSKAREVGGFVKLWKAMRSKNACKTCALGMGGQAGGMVNEAGHCPEVCKKSLQAMVADMQGAVRGEFFETYSVPQLQAFSPARAGMVRPAHARRCCRTGRHALSPDHLGRRDPADRRPAEATPRRTKPFGTSAAAARTRPASCCSSSPGSTAPTTSTIAPTTATRPAASA